MNEYYYFNCRRPQYYFQKVFFDNLKLEGFYKPYSLAGKISWFIFKNFAPYRFFFKTGLDKTSIPEEKIRSIIGIDAEIALNTGTVGLGRKITGISHYNNDYLFFKYAETPEAVSNVINEFEQLKLNHSLTIAPDVLGFWRLDEAALLTTSLFEGEKLDHVRADADILNCLYQVGRDLNHKKIDNRTLMITQSHGDFCPWNIMKVKGEIRVFDWEYGGDNPLGFDLFTFVFQPAFLLDSRRRPEEIIKENRNIFFEYFLHYGQDEWSEYLLAFAKIMNHRQERNGSFELACKYRRLIEVLN